MRVQQSDFRLQAPGAISQKLESRNQGSGEKTKEKLKRLEDILHDMGSVLVAFSGGLDSTFLLKVASDVLHGEAVALTAMSPTYPERELKEARRLARKMGVNHIIVDSDELLIPNFSDNTERRCYYCKSELFKICTNKASELGLAFVIDGSNLDDLSDFRPGRDAANEFNIRSPLVEACLSKGETRELSREMGLETYDKPPFACLSSRFPYGTRITAERLEMVEVCEETLVELGFRQFRVRYHDSIARIEIEPSELGYFLQEEIRGKVIERFKEAGFTYITLDLQGYRTGSMNEVLEGVQEAGIRS
jgi:uncharacterized protein